MNDRRILKRTQVMRNAKIIVPHRSPVIHCTVMNINSGGACLAMANTAGVPQQFELTFEHGRTRRSCHVVWRTSDRIGVAFEGAEKLMLAPVAPTDAQVATTDAVLPAEVRGKAVG